MKSNEMNLLYMLGRPFAPFYGWLMSFRSALYKKGVLKQHRLPVPVVSIGNLTLGGTGKTPMTMYLARLLADRKPAVVSRGYGGKNKKPINIVSDGQHVASDAGLFGDEPILMAESLPGVPVLTGKRRYVVGHHAVSQLGAGLVLLDDGFQHLAIDRNVNIVLFKVDSFLGNNRVFPGGDMREPLKALERADCFVLTCVDDENRERAQAIQKALVNRFPAIPSFLASYNPAAVISADGIREDLTKAQEKSWLAFCGLGQPLSFKRSLAVAGIDILDFQVFEDHHIYSEKDLQSLIDMAERTGAYGLITTEKDLVKLRGMRCEFPLMALQMSVVPEEGFDQFILGKLS